MAYFPLFVDLKGKKILVVGGGAVALRKIKSLLPFSPVLIVVAPKINDEIKALEEKDKVQIFQRIFKDEDLSGCFCALVATDNPEVQQRVYQLCEERGVFCNCADSPKECHFVFPSLIVRGDLSIGFSTAGKAPVLSARLRREIERVLPPGLEALIEKLYRLRESLPKGEDRQKRMRAAIEEMFEGE